MFIVFEGLDGSGQSTQADLLRDYLATVLGKRTVLTKEQTDGIIGGFIKSCLKKEWSVSPLTLQLLFAADRAHHLSKEIEPALNEGKIVISDRYFFSSFAFGSLNVDIKCLKEINSQFRNPDLSFFLDVPPEVCLERIWHSRVSHLELFEQREKMEQVQQNYLALAKEFKNFHVIDGNRPKEEVFEEIRKIVDKKLKLR